MTTGTASSSSQLPSTLDRLSIQSTAFPSVYLRADGRQEPLHKTDGHKMLNLQVTRMFGECFEFIPQDPSIYGFGVYVIRSVMCPEWFVFLDPTVFPVQAPKHGTTFHPWGIGRSSVVSNLDKASRFKVVENVVEGEPITVSLKLVGVPTLTPNVYLRLDGGNSTEFRGTGSGNGQRVCLHRPLRETPRRTLSLSGHATALLLLCMDGRSALKLSVCSCLCSLCRFAR